jgi:hypothetical protein
MKRLHLTCAVAALLAAAGAYAAPQDTSGGVADPQAPTPATRAQPAIDYRTEPAPAAPPDATWRAANATVGGRNAMRLTMPGMQGGHEHHAGMDMGAMPATTGMQCMAGGGCACCGGKDKMPVHDGHAGMQCKSADGGCGCGCCTGMATKDGGGCCDHKERM